MVTKTITEQRAEVRIFAGNDPAHTATGSSGISSATPALTPLMLDEATGKLVVWDGQKAGSAVGILVLPLEGTETVLTYYKSGTRPTVVCVSSPITSNRKSMPLSRWKKCRR